MTKNTYRIVSLCATFFVFIHSLIGTYGWQSIGQQVINEVYGSKKQMMVRLIKKETLEDGTIVAESKLAGAKFLLYTEDGQVMGEPYITDKNGEISVSLPIGSYYFKEIEPPIGYWYEEKNGKEVEEYPFLVREEEGEVVVEAYNQKKYGGFRVEKTVENKNGAELSEEQKEQEFQFLITISNERISPPSLYDGEIEYFIDHGTTKKFKNGTTISLKHGQIAYFPSLPIGLSYQVKEVPRNNYTIQSIGHVGVIQTLSSSAIFINQYEEKEEKPSKLRITKKIIGTVPKEEKQREFLFELILDGKKQKFTLIDGETKEFEVEAGQRYEVKEEKVTGYKTVITNGYGTVPQGGEVVEVVATNTYDETTPILTKIQGEKTWNLLEDQKIELPKSIEIMLKQGDRIVATKKVTPNKDGTWLYEFEVPKYDQHGEEIMYHVEEVPLDAFYPTYQGYHIVNTPYEPVFLDPPIIRKEVKGLTKEEAKQYKFIFEIKGIDDAPMPKGADGQVKRFVQMGVGETELGEICYTKTGTYRYEIIEIDTKEDGFIYDKSYYMLYVYVTEQNGKLQVAHQLIKNEQQVEQIVFVNTYEDPNELPEEVIRVPVIKRWEHGTNPEEKHPDTIIISLYADGKLYMQRAVTKEDGWSTEFVVPKYSSRNKEIVYTIDEEAIPNYRKTIKNNIITNTYMEEVPSTEDSPKKEEEFNQENSNSSKTDDLDSGHNNPKTDEELNGEENNPSKVEVPNKDNKFPKLGMKHPDNNHISLEGNHIDNTTHQMEMDGSHKKTNVAKTEDTFYRTIYIVLLCSSMLALFLIFYKKNQRK